MNRKGNFLQGSIFFLFISLAVFIFSGGLKAADEAPQPPAPKPASQPSSAVLATTDGEESGTRVEVTELKRASGGTLNLKFTMINDSNEKMGFGSRFAEGGSSANTEYGTISGVHLIDPVGKKKYFVLRDTEGKCVCSGGTSGLPEIKPGSRINLYAKFPAPPDDVKKITVEIPHFTPMDDVPISQ